MATASGTAPLTYQWFKDGSPLTDGTTGAGTVISGAASPTLVLSNVFAASAADYTLVVSNSAGAAESLIAHLTIIDPVINVQPASLTLIQGSTAIFSVSAIGTAPLTYQWLRDGTNVVNDSRISGSQTSTFGISNVNNRDALTNY